MMPLGGREVMTERNMVGRGVPSSRKENDLKETTK